MFHPSISSTVKEKSHLNQKGCFDLDHSLCQSRQFKGQSAGVWLGPEEGKGNGVVGQPVSATHRTWLSHGSGPQSR